jgi:hypothetical protein
MRLSVWRQVLGEPILHFLVLGALVFGVDAGLTAWRGDPSTITVGKAEMAVLVDHWVQSEVLYREGLALGLDRGDAGIREKVVANAVGMIRSEATVPPTDEAGLRAWFAAHRDRYPEGASFEALGESRLKADRDEAVLAELTAKAVQGMAARYRVVVGDDKP